MNQHIVELAKKLGTSIADRDSFETWLYDGETIASYYVVSPDPMDKPGSEFYFAPYRIYYGDVDVLHELGHLQACAPEQKDLPEYGLAIGVAEGSGYGPAGGEFRTINGNLRENISMDVFNGLVDKEEQDKQEKLAQLFSIFWGEAYSIPFEMRNWDECKSWDYYFRYKIALDDGDPHSDKSLKKAWEVLIFFRKMVESGEVVK